MERNDLVSQPLSFELLSWSFSLDFDWPNFIPQHRSEVDWIEFSENIGLICHVSSGYSSFGYDSVKVSGVFLLIGIGSWLCCKLIKLYHSAFSGSNGSSSDTQGKFGAFFKTSYFGPTPSKKNTEVEEESPLRLIAQSEVNANSTSTPAVPMKRKVKCRSETHSCSVKSSPIRRVLSVNSSPILRYRDRSESEWSSMDIKQETSSESISELSLDVDTTTFARLDQLQEEIDQIKSNCLSMDEEFVTIKGSRNLPGLSNLMETNELNDGQQNDECIQNAKKCFKGLYSLTTINQSMSLDLSDYRPVSIDDSKEFDKSETLIMDEENLPSLEWDELEDVSERSMSVASGNQSSYSISEMSAVDDNNCILNIGPKVDVISYSSAEWKGNSKKAESIRQGYNEVVQSLGLKYLHRIRGDNYCAIRATLFQVLTQNVPLPSAEQAYNILRNGSTEQLIKSWQFTRLPYSNNINEGIRNCLLTLDRLAAKLSGVEDKSSVIQCLLNSDPLLDLQLNEAVKLLMLERTIHLFNSMNDGADVPLFTVLMFARSTSLNVSDFMRNHLCKVGDSGGLEMVEMFLLGYTLNVKLRVIRPSAFGTEDFICYYPEECSTSWPQVTLIAEDDRHYNILVD